MPGASSSSRSHTLTVSGSFLQHIQVYFACLSPCVPPYREMCVQGASHRQVHKGPGTSELFGMKNKAPLPLFLFPSLLLQPSPSPPQPPHPNLRSIFIPGHVLSLVLGDETQQWPQGGGHHTGAPLMWTGTRLGAWRRSTAHSLASCWRRAEGSVAPSRKACASGLLGSAPVKPFLVEFGNNLS